MGECSFSQWTELHSFFHFCWNITSSLESAGFWTAFGRLVSCGWHAASLCPDWSLSQRVERARGPLCSHRWGRELLVSVTERSREGGAVRAAWQWGPCSTVSPHGLFFACVRIPSWSPLAEEVPRSCEHRVLRAQGPASTGSACPSCPFCDWRIPLPVLLRGQGVFPSDVFHRLCTLF